MRALQDDFFEKVGVKHQHARLGPRRRRLTRAQWLQEQQQLAQLSKLIRAGKLTLAKAQKQAGLIVEQAKADAQKLGVKLGAFFGGLAGRAREGLLRAERQRDEERLKRQNEQQKRVKAEKHAQEMRQKLVHERLSSDQRIDNLVAMKLLPLQRQLEIEAKQRARAVMKSALNGGVNNSLTNPQQQQGPKQDK